MISFHLIFSLLSTWCLVFLAKDVPGLPAPLSTTPLFLLLSPPLFCSLARPCGFAPSLSLPFSFSVLCLDSLTKDCQGFQPLLSFPSPLISLTPSLLPHCFVRRLCCCRTLISRVLGEFRSIFLLLRCLNCLAKDVSGFSTLAPSPLVSSFCVAFGLFWLLFVCLSCVGSSLSDQFRLSRLTGVLESSDQRRVRVLNTPHPPP